MHSLCPSSHTPAKIEKRLGFLTSKADGFEYNENAEALAQMGYQTEVKIKGYSGFLLFSTL